MVIDVAAWYEKYGPMVIRRCRSILKDSDEAMDAVHDVFVNLLRRKMKIQDRFPSSLLYTMATNVCLNRLRKEKRKITWDFSARADESFSLDEGFSQVEANLLVEAILKDEPEMSRTICFMHYADGMTLKEIGEAVGLSAAGVWKQLDVFKHRAYLKFGEEVRKKL
ncbi:MAG: RNA polymerase sigma factor [Treponema sp.]|jgi:RNA polymerase sigma-70 factor (ECF subfamily)|nr:RNA polymerase sigma factor [Treponema sp.]